MNTHRDEHVHTCICTLALSTLGDWVVSTRVMVQVSCELCKLVIWSDMNI